MATDTTAELKREDFRIDLNNHRQPIICHLTIEGYQFSTYAVNISITGICVICDSKNPQPKLGQTYYGCQIILPGIGKIDVNLLVRHVESVYMEANRQVCKCGCKFVDLSIDIERKISKFIHQCERDYLLHRVEVANG